jgi:chitodextrinase
LQPNTAYEITVSAFDHVPNESAPSASITGTTSGPDTEAPTTPSNLSSTAVTTNSISLVWDASADNMGVTGYHVYADGLLKGTPSSNSYMLTQLLPGTTYQVSVSAFDAASNESAQSEPVSITTVALPDDLPPTIPVNLTVSGTTQTTISLSWIHSIDNIGVTGYRIYVDGLLDGTAATNSYTITELSPNTPYEISVSAFDAAANESGKSMPVMGKTKESPDIIAPILQATDSIYAEGIVEVSSSEDGMIYLVQEGTASDLSIILANSIYSAAVTKDLLLNLPISGLENGNYWLYATDAAGNISDPKIITIFGVGIENRMAGNSSLYPNPFSKSTTLSFSLYGNQQIRLTIIDSQGRVIRTESLGELQTGEQSVTIHREGLPPGLYFFKLENEQGKNATGRLVVED